MVSTRQSFVAYYRVSTARQGRSGLGLDAQRAAVEAHAQAVGARIVGAYREIETGRNDQRPELAKALRHARVTRSTLVVGKLDRLSRNATFLLTLRDAGVPIVAADMPEAGRLQVGLMAVIAEHEREAISRRTREALAAAKARGVQLGNPNGAAPLRRAGKGNKASLAAIAERVALRAADVAPEVEALRADGATTLGALAAGLRARGVPCSRGGAEWTRAGVARLLAQIAAATRPAG
jgi:DNA invertase Pin-like site-specific DNA recombinase